MGPGRWDFLGRNDLGYAGNDIGSRAAMFLARRTRAKPVYSACLADGCRALGARRPWTTRPMDAPPPDFRELKFHSRIYHERQRLEAFRQILGRKMLHTDIDALSDAPASVEAKLRLLPDLRFGSGTVSAMRQRRTRSQACADNDDLVLVVNLEGTMVATQRGSDFALGPGDAFIFSCLEAGAYLRPEAGALLTMRLPHAALATRIADIDDKIGQIIGGDQAALRLLRRYLNGMDDDLLSTQRLRELCTSHVYDLVAALCDPQPDAAAAIRDGGVAAPRRRAMKDFIAAHLGSPSLSVGTLAAQFGLSPRQIQRLFESEGCTFSEYVLQERLACVRARLSTAEDAERRISDLVLDHGFGDVSSFNRAFKRRYGRTPGDIRRQISA